MNSKQIEYFLTLASLGSFSKASEKLSISQPSLSQYIKKLEGEIGCELFIRGSQTLALTQSGEAFLRYARTVGDLERNLHFELEDIKNDFSGKIKIGISHFRCSGMMPEVVSQFRKIYPDIKIMLYEKTVSELAADMSDFLCDIFILPHDREYPDYESMDIAEEKFVLAVPVRIANNYSLPAALSEKNKEIDLSLLSGAEFISLFEGQKAEIELSRLCKESNTDINIVARCVDVETMYSLTLSGTGASLLPETVLDRRANDIRIYNVKNSKNRKIAAFLPKNAYRSKPIMTFLNILKKIN